MNNELIKKLSAIFGDRFSQSIDVIKQHGESKSHYPEVPPDAVVYAETRDEVKQLVDLCREYQTPLIAYGAGTSLEGHFAATQGGICLDLKMMNRILSVNQKDMDAVVQPGLMRSELNEHLKSSGLFFPVGPGADASFGGMSATRASGTNAVRYGTMKENVLALEVVMADGSVIRSGSRARKSSAGYDLTHLFVGSEGTLGVITEITVRLQPKPASTIAAVCSFSTLKGAVDSVIQTIQAGVPIARVELLDDVSMAAVNHYSQTNYSQQPTLFLEFHGAPLAVEEQVKTVEKIAQHNTGGEFKWAVKEDERKKLWQARHDLVYACQALKPNAVFWATDVCVPVSQLTECILETRRDIEQTGIIGPIAGHVGDGNFHVAMVIERGDKEELQRCTQFYERLLKRALKMGGTITGEHGIGDGKRRYMREEHGDAVDVMSSIKKALDPQNIMNPGKILPD